MAAHSAVCDIVSSGWVGGVRVSISLARTGLCWKSGPEHSAVQTGKCFPELLGPSPPAQPDEVQSFFPLLVSQWVITNATQLEPALQYLPRAITDRVTVLPVSPALR